MVSSDLRTRWQFFMEHACWSVPPGRAACALWLARAEVLREDAEEYDVVSVEWLDDEVPYDPVCMSDAEVAAEFESGRWTGPFGCVLRVEGEVSASLWGIVVGPRGTGDPYCRVVEAELTEEVADEIRQALGDAKDAELTLTSR